MDEHGNIIIYKDKNGNDNIEVKLQDNTVWLNQEQLVLAIPQQSLFIVEQTIK